MRKYYPFYLCLIAVFMVLGSPEISGEAGKSQAFPGANREAYRDPAGTERIYMVQEPEDLKHSPNILIYMHGSAGKEEQGMDPVWENRTFARLRTLLNKLGWVYVCPRDAEFNGLLKHLKQKYQTNNVYLAGASAGGHEAIAEAVRNPSSYAGLLLLCPAFRNGTGDDPARLTMPVWIVSGEKDRRITEQCRKLVSKLEELKKPHIYREIKGGHHGTPVEKANWEKALAFLQYASLPAPFGHDGIGFRQASAW